MTDSGSTIVHNMAPDIRGGQAFYLAPAGRALRPFRMEQWLEARCAATAVFRMPVLARAERRRGATSGNGQRQAIRAPVPAAMGTATGGWVAGRGYDPRPWLTRVLDRRAVPFFSTF